MEEQSALDIAMELDPVDETKQMTFPPVSPFVSDNGDTTWTLTPRTAQRRLVNPTPAPGDILPTPSKIIRDTPTKTGMFSVFSDTQSTQSPARVMTPPGTAHTPSKSSTPRSALGAITNSPQQRQQSKKRLFTQMDSPAKNSPLRGLGVSDSPRRGFRV